MYKRIAREAGAREKQKMANTIVMNTERYFKTDLSYLDQLILMHHALSTAMISIEILSTNKLCTSPFGRSLILPISIINV